jgi:carbon monoxide dehydrogenase subunit G
VSAERPNKIVERNVGAGGRRVANGRYILDAARSGGTRIVFEYAWQRAPLSERLASPLVRAVLRRGNQRAMQRLAEQLGDRVVSPGRSPPPANIHPWLAG